LSDEYIVIAAFGLMLLASFGSLLLIFRLRRLNATIRRLEAQIKAVPDRTQVAA
jgi:hypothetical protein